MAMALTRRLVMPITARWVVDTTRSLSTNRYCLLRSALAFYLGRLAVQCTWQFFEYVTRSRLPCCLGASSDIVVRTCVKLVRHGRYSGKLRSHSLSGGGINRPSRRLACRCRLFGDRVAGVHPVMPFGWKSRQPELADVSRQRRSDGIARRMALTCVDTVARRA